MTTSLFAVFALMVAGAIFIGFGLGWLIGEKVEKEKGWEKIAEERNVNIQLTKENEILRKGHECVYQELLQIKEDLQGAKDKVYSKAAP